MNRILIATDGSAAAEQAVEIGVELARAEEAGVAIVYAVPRIDLSTANGQGVVGFGPYEPTRKDDAILERAIAVARREDVPVVSHLLHGDPVAEIVAYAELFDVDLIVVGSCGHGAIASALLGSVSRGVLALAKRPVLVVRASLAAEPVAV
jgi:nucleotide-binding universal stress UspA family protein